MSMSPRLAFVVAVARNGVIGRDGGLPWRQSSDLKTFRRLTIGKPLIMGRRTFVSIGKPLDGRDNIVVTRDPAFGGPDVITAASPADAVAKAQICAKARQTDEIMVIGGAQIYHDLMAKADRLYWTAIDADVDGDARFPALDWAEWREVSREPIPRTAKDDHPATLITFDRNDT